MKKLFQQVRFKIFILNCSVLVIGVVCLGFLLYSTTSTDLTNQINTRIDNLSKSLVEQINYYFIDYQNDLVYLAQDFAGLDYDEEKINNLVNKSSIKISHDVNNIYYLSNENETSIHDNQIVYDYAKKSKGNFIVMGPYNDSRNGYNLAILYKCIHMGELKGVIVCEISLDKLNKRFNSMNAEKDATMLIFNSENNIVACDIRIQQNEYSNLYDYIHDSILTNDNSIEYSESLKEQYIIKKSSVGFIGWNVVLISDKSVMLKPTQNILRMTVLFMILLSAIIAGVSLYLAHYINHPLNSIITQMKNINSHNLSTPVTLKRKDEFYVLADAYNKMLEKLDKIIDEKAEAIYLKKEYEYKSLQAQIKPHFIFNSLNVVKSMFETDNKEKIPSIMNALSQLIRYSFDKENDTVTLGKELQSVEQFVLLYNTRLEKDIRIFYDLDYKIMNCIILKLTLQPIVENALIHAFRDYNSENKIEIGGHETNDGKDLLIYVMDNGKGISPEKVKVILTKQYENKNSFNSIGLYNVNERLKQKFGEKYGLTMISDNKNGTRVEIILPKIVKGEENNE